MRVRTTPPWYARWLGSPPARAIGIGTASAGLPMPTV